MNIVSKLSIKNLKMNKKRTISTIVGIILSVALICAVASLATSFQKSLIQNAINERGYYHIKLMNIQDNNIREIQNNRDIKEVYTTYENGYAILNGCKNEDKPYLRVYSMNEETFFNLKFKLVEGSFPTNSNEVIISKHIISNGKVDYKIGDKIKINVGQRKTLDDYELFSSNPYDKENEKLVDTKEAEFTIVGIIERPSYSFEDYSDPGYTIITTNKNEGKEDAYIALKKPKEYETSINELLGTKDYTKETSSKYEQVYINDELLRWEAFAFDDNTVSMLYAVCGVVISIIIFTSVFCIRNSFAIATTEKIKMYGMLSSVGATKKQIKKSVILEGLILGLIGVPLGILSGIFAVFVLVKIVNLLIGEYLLSYIDGLLFSTSWVAVILSVVLGFVTIYLSAISSSIRASKVSPIEQLRNSNDIKIKNNKLKVPKIISKLFKTGGVLAYKNLKRSKKKYKATVISIAVSIFIFITMNSFLTNAFGFTSNYYNYLAYNVEVYNIRDLKQEDVNKIISQRNIKECFTVFDSEEYYLKIYDLSKVNQYEGDSGLSYVYYEYNEAGDIIYEQEKFATLELIALDDKTFRNYANEIGAKYEDVKSSGILCDQIQYYDSKNNTERLVRRYTYSKGETIDAKYDEKDISIKVGFVTDIRPYGLEHSYYGGGYLVVNKDEYPDINFVYSMILIESNNPEELKEDISSLGYQFYVSNLDEQVKAEKGMRLVISIFLYGFIAVITLIGVTNIFNTITSNMELRQKEFAMLKSIGMTKKEFNRMINLETIFYCTKALLIGIVLGLLGTLAIYKAFSIKLDSGIYIPIKPIIISIISVFILVFIIMKYSINKINKQNTIETIRKENI